MTPKLSNGYTGVHLRPVVEYLSLSSRISQPSTALELEYLSLVVEYLSLVVEYLSLVQP